MAGQFLTNAERERYEQVPSTISEEDLNQYFYLSPHDIIFIKGQRGNAQRLGFACQLCLIRFMGFLPDNWQETIPSMALKRLNYQLKTKQADLKNYSERYNTRSNHLQLILKYLGYSKCAILDVAELESWLLERALEHDKPTLLLELACERLIFKKILRPSIGTLERMVVTIRARAYVETYSRLDGFLDPELKIKLDDILIVEQKNSFTRFAWLKEYPNSNKPVNINKSLRKYQFLINLGVDGWDITMLNPNRRKFLAQKARRTTNQEIQRMNDEKRYPLLVGFLCQNLIDVTDSIIDMFIDYIEDVHHTCKRQLENYQKNTTNAKDRAMETLCMVATIVSNEDIPSEQIRNQLYKKISSDELTEAISVTNEILRPSRNNFLSFLDNHFGNLRLFSNTFLKTITFHTAIRGDDFLYAVQIVLSLQNGTLKKMPKDAPTKFITPTWSKYVFDEGHNIIKKSYEWCVHFTLKDRLKSGDIYVSNSRKYADIDGYLIPKELWIEIKDDVCQQMHVSTNPYEHINQKIKEFKELLPLVNDLLDQPGESGEIRLENGNLIVPRIRALEIPDSAKKLEKIVSSRLPLVNLPELVMEVNSWTGFTNELTSIHDGKVPDKKQINLVYAGLLSNACNIPWIDMSRSANIEYYDLLWSIKSYQREDTLKLANNLLVNYHHKQWLASLWGGGTLSSSDGQRLPTSGKIRKAKAQLNYFGFGRGLTNYTHTSDQYSQYGTKVVATTERDATYVLDEILNNETELNIIEHTTDTAGYTDIVFGLFDLLGLKFSPRLSDIKDQKLSKIKGYDIKYPTLKFTGTVNPEYFARQWDDLLRIAGSMKIGHVTASLFIGKLQAFPRQNNLTYVIQEYGKLIKTIFIMKILIIEALQRTINKQLNKSEAMHALRSFLRIGGDGKIRKKQEEQQQEQALCLNLVTNCVVIWNTVYMQEILRVLETEGYPLDSNDIMHLSPARFEHINKMGKYTFELDESMINGGLRKLRDNP